MSYVAFTLPEAVAFYKGKGDSVFQQRFNLSDTEFNDFLQDGNIREIKKESPSIHVKYEFLNINVIDVESNEEIIFAVSRNDGNSWFFVEKVDYFNDAIVSDAKRLIKE